MNHFPLSTWADRAEWRWPAVGIVLLVIVIGAYGLVQADEHLDELQAVEDARIEAQRQAGDQLRRQQLLQDQCGGPEATVVELANGGYDCLDANGRRTKRIQGGKS